MNSTVVSPGPSGQTSDDAVMAWLRKEGLEVNIENYRAAAASLDGTQEVSDEDIPDALKE